MMNFGNWKSLMLDFGFSENRTIFEQLIAAHTQKARHYHSDKHISACLRHLEAVQQEVIDKKSLALAFWFHDAIYKPFSSTNERDSADWAVTFLRENGASGDQVKRVEDLIMATCHNADASDPDMQILIDIDLSILGAKPDVYDVYEKNIRKEYRKVPGFLFRRKRKELLSGFLNKTQIFGSPYFFKKLEKQARQNLTRAISIL